MALLSGAIKRARTAWPAVRADVGTAFGGMGRRKDDEQRCPSEAPVPAAVPGAAGDAGPHLRPARAQMASRRPRLRGPAYADVATLPAGPR
jgi:hypothetical protein